MARKTLGQRAYEAYIDELGGAGILPSWTRISEPQRDAWQVAAQEISSRARRLARRQLEKERADANCSTPSTS